MRYFIGLLFLLCVTVVKASAPAPELQVSVSVSKKIVNVQETFTLTITLRGQGVERLRMPELFPPSFTVIDKSDKPSLSQDALGRPVSGRIIRYQLQPTQGGKFRIGTFTVTYFGEQRTISGEVVDVIGPRAKPEPERASSALSESERVDVRLTAEADQTRVYVGERITLSIRVTHNAYIVDEIKPIELPQFANFWNKEITLTRHVYPRKEITIQGRPYVTQMIPRFYLFPTTAGKLIIPPLTYTMQAFSAVMSSARPPVPRVINIKTQPINIEVMPLPDEGKPAEFRGAVGRANMKVFLKDQVTRVGVPTQLIVEIETEGNIDSITPPLLPQMSGIKTYDLNRVNLNEEKNASNDGDVDKIKKQLATARWQAEVVPTTAGKHSIPPIKFAYFDPDTRKYQLLESEALALEAAAANNLTDGERGTSKRPIAGIVSRPAVRNTLLVLLAAAGVVTAAFRLKRARRVVKKELPKAAPPVNPVVAEVNKIVNSSYGKLHRGEERAYAQDMLRAVRMIFEHGFAVAASDLTGEKIGQLLDERGIDHQLTREAIDLYQECERISFSPITDIKSAPAGNFARFQQARAVIDRLLKLLPPNAP